MFDGLSQEKTQVRLNTAHSHQMGKMGRNYWLDSKDDRPGGVSVTNFYLSKQVTNQGHIPAIRWNNSHEPADGFHRPASGKATLPKSISVLEHL